MNMELDLFLLHFVLMLTAFCIRCEMLSNKIDSVLNISV